MSAEKIQTICRIRPVSSNGDSNVRVNSSQTLTLTHKGSHEFTYDKVCEPEIEQKGFYESNIKFILPHILQGKNTTLICYGPTGSGKTYTMYGNVFKNMEMTVNSARGSQTRKRKRRRRRAKKSKFKSSYNYDSDDSNETKVSHSNNSSGSNSSKRTRSGIQEVDAKLLKSSGVVNRLMKDLLRMYYTPSVVENLTSCTIDVSMLQLYNENLYDLLNSNGSETVLEMKEIRGKISIPNCTVTRIRCYSDFLKVLSSGRQRLKIAATSLNSTSSRSHTILYIQFKQYYELEGRSKFSKIMIVDLAGSEQIKMSEVKGVNMQEAININKSLTMLGMVIAQLTSNQSHISYRDSKLTRLLKDSLGGSSKCVMVLNISQDPRLSVQTISTLRFGERVKIIKNKTKINLRRPLKWYIQQYEKLKKELTKYKKLYQKLLTSKPPTRNSNSPINVPSQQQQQQHEEQKQKRTEESDTKKLTVPKFVNRPSKLSIRDQVLLNMQNKGEKNTPDSPAVSECASTYSVADSVTNSYVLSERLSVIGNDVGVYSEFENSTFSDGSDRMSEDINEFVQASGLANEADNQVGEQHQLFIIDQEVTI